MDCTVPACCAHLTPCQLADKQLVGRQHMMLHRRWTTCTTAAWCTATSSRTTSSCLQAAPSHVRLVLKCEPAYGICAFEHLAGRQDPRNRPSRHRNYEILVAVSDFGCATRGGGLQSRCSGTPAFLAPEMMAPDARYRCASGFCCKTSSMLLASSRCLKATECSVSGGAAWPKPCLSGCPKTAGDLPAAAAPRMCMPWAPACTPSPSERSRCGQ